MSRKHSTLHRWSPGQAIAFSVAVGAVTLLLIAALTLPAIITNAVKSPTRTSTVTVEVTPEPTPSCGTCDAPFEIDLSSNETVHYWGNNCECVSNTNTTDVPDVEDEMAASGCYLDIASGPETVYMLAASAEERNITVSTCQFLGATWDTVVYVRFENCTSAVETYCNDHAGTEVCGLLSVMSVVIPADTVAYIYVDGYEADECGSYVLSVTPVIPGE